MCNLPNKIVFEPNVEDDEEVAAVALANGLLVFTVLCGGKPSIAAGIA